MKKLFILCTIGAALILSSCKKEIAPTEIIPPKEDNTSISVETLTKLDYFKLLAERVLTNAKNSTVFKSWIYNECYREYDGDYYVKFSHLLDLNAENGYEHWSMEEAELISGIISEIEQIDINNNEVYTEPVIFVPFIEDLDIDSLINECPANIPEAVFELEYDTASTHCIGYTLNSSNALTDFKSDIDEEYAWANDVWVFRQEELSNVSTYSFKTLFPIGQSGEQQRINGRAEYGGIIQVTNMKQLESWIAGKFEFRYYVYSANGLKIKDRKFDPVKRKYINNLQWKDFGDFIANWNTGNIGNFMIEGWTELDGGTSSSISMTIPSSCTGCPSYNVSVPSENKDEDMGQTIVQFTDPVKRLIPLQRFTKSHLQTLSDEINL